MSNDNVRERACDLMRTIGIAKPVTRDNKVAI